MDFLLGHGNEDYEGKDTAFLDWLTENGSRFEKIQWPAMTQNGLRGAVALEHIKSGEHMVTVPWRLMLSVIHAAEDPEMGHVYKENKSLLRNDNGLALFIMQEMIRGKSSFYWPFLRILPKPGSISCWGDVSLAELQDDNLVQRSKTRAKHHRVLYDRTMEVLCERYPDLFSREQYTFELFVFAWGTIQARAFGKRLPWSCLVPFADCLNHGNVQTKYDYDVGGSKTFRLFPSGENEYLQGAEVLNSYGRRPNDNLLMEYGFAILDNEWDEVEVTCCLDTSDPLYSRKRTLLRLNSLFTSRTVRLNRSNWPSTMLHFHRCAVLTGPELEEWESTVDNLHHVSASSQFHQGPNRLDKYGILESSEDLLWGNTPVECGKCTKDPARERKEEGNCSGDIEGGQFVGKWKGFPQNTISMGNELEALKQVHIKLQIKWDGFPTTLTHDEELLRNCGKDHTAAKTSALVYRITTKRILREHISLTERVIDSLQCLANTSIEKCDNTRDNSCILQGEINQCSRKIQDKVFPSMSACHWADTVGNKRLLESFMSYMAGLQKRLIPKGG